MSETMIERVARIIDPIAWSDLAALTWRDGGVEKAQKDALKTARAAIEAMREPTRRMIEAGAIGSGEDSENTAIGAYEAMIDEALSAAPAP